MITPYLLRITPYHTIDCALLAVARVTCPENIVVIDGSCEGDIVQVVNHSRIFNAAKEAHILKNNAQILPSK
jgi:hypothetical protein